MPSTSAKYIKEYTIGFDLTTTLSQYCNIWWTTLSGNTVPSKENISVGDGSVTMNGKAIEISGATDSKLQDGYYLIIAKGGNGGKKSGNNGGSGGIVAGIIQFKPKSGEKIFVFLGTNGGDVGSSTAGGTNGLGLGLGGTGGTGGGGGGAATVVFLSNTGSYAENNMIIVAAGGGGARSTGARSTMGYPFSGGMGGKIINKPAEGTIPYGKGTNGGTTTYGADGSTGGSGNASGTRYSYPSGGKGGEGASNAGGGGGGYAGGGGGYSGPGATDGGGGGSSFAKNENDVVRMTTFDKYQEVLGKLFTEYNITGVAVLPESTSTYYYGVLGDGGTYYWDRSFISLSYLGADYPSEYISTAP